MNTLRHDKLVWWVRAGALAAILIACTLVWAKVRFGSLGAARAYFRGEVVEVSFVPSEKDDVDADDGSPLASEVTVAFTNNAPEPITIVGAITQCSCLEVKSLPLTLPPLSAGNLTKAVLSRIDSDSTTAAPQRVVFITDSPLMPQIVADLPDYPVTVASHN